MRAASGVAPEAEHIGVERAVTKLWCASSECTSERVGRCQMSTRQSCDAVASVSSAHTVAAYTAPEWPDARGSCCAVAASDGSSQSLTAPSPPAVMSVSFHTFSTYTSFSCAVSVARVTPPSSGDHVATDPSPQPEMSSAGETALACDAIARICGAQRAAQCAISHAPDLAPISVDLGPFACAHAALSSTRASRCSTL